MTHKLVFILTLILTIKAYSGWTQTTQPSFSFVDLYGDTLTITNVNRLPRPLDSTFFKTNLTGLHFDTTLTHKNIRYDYILLDIKGAKKKNEFEFALRIVSHSREAEDLIKYLGGPSHYRMTIKKVDGRLVIDTIEFLYGEV
ncbi:MAG: hypothetical protein ACM3O8_10355 [Methylococcaceae bacterium]